MNFDRTLHHTRSIFEIIRKQPISERTGGCKKSWHLFFSVLKLPCSFSERLCICTSWPSLRRGIEATRTAGSNAENPSKSRRPHRGCGLATLLPYWSSGKAQVF